MMHLPSRMEWRICWWCLRHGVVPKVIWRSPLVFVMERWVIGMRYPRDAWGLYLQFPAAMVDLFGAIFGIHKDELPF